MDTKYYTPDIEEFHIGFEYEVDVSCIYDSGNRWVQYDTDAAISFKYDKSLYKAIQDQLIRVKYLDKEDIESLGFEYDGFINDDISMFSINTDSSGYTNKASNRYILRFEKRIGRILISTNKHHYRFFGTVKNKSELKTLLKQLGIK